MGLVFRLKLVDQGLMDEQLLQWWFELWDWGEREEESHLHILSFFTFLGNLYPQNAAVTLTLPPWTSHHCAPPTAPNTAVVVLLWLEEFDKND